MQGTTEELNDAIELSQLAITSFSDSLVMRRICKRVSKRLEANGWTPLIGSHVATKSYRSQATELYAFVVDRGGEALILGVQSDGFFRDCRMFDVSIPKAEDEMTIRHQVAEFVFKIEQRFDSAPYLYKIKARE